MAKQNSQRDAQASQSPEPTQGESALPSSAETPADDVAAESTELEQTDVVAQVDDDVKKSAADEYVVLSPLNHNGKRYEIGESVVLTLADAQPLLDTVIKPAEVKPAE